MALPLEVLVSPVLLAKKVAVIGLTTLRQGLLRAGQLTEASAPPLA